MDLFGWKARRDQEHEALMARIAADRAKSDAEHAERLEMLRAATETQERARHQQQLEVLETVLSRVQAISEGGQQVMQEVAIGIQKNAEAINTWMQLFQQNQGPGDVHTVRPEDEYKAWQQREMNQLAELGYIQKPAGDAPAVELPEEAVRTIAGMFANDRG